MPVTKVHSKWSSGNLQFYTIASSGTSYPFTLLGTSPASTSGDIIGFQAKAGAVGTTASTANVYGGQIQPRFNDGTPGASLIGLNIEAILKGATAAALTGDVRGIEVGLSADGAGHTVGGVAVGLRLYNLLKASTFTGGVYPISIEANGDTQAWSSALKIATNATLAKYSGGHYGTLGAIDGAIKVTLDTHDLWIPCYASIAA